MLRIGVDFERAHVWVGMVVPKIQVVNHPGDDFWIYFFQLDAGSFLSTDQRTPDDIMKCEDNLL